MGANTHAYTLTHSPSQENQVLTLIASVMAEGSSVVKWGSNKKWYTCVWPVLVTVLVTVLVAVVVVVVVAAVVVAATKSSCTSTFQQHLCAFHGGFIFSFRLSFSSCQCQLLAFHNKQQTKLFIQPKPDKQPQHFPPQHLQNPQFCMSCVAVQCVCDTTKSILHTTEKGKWRIPPKEESSCQEKRGKEKKRENHACGHVR